MAVRYVARDVGNSDHPQGANGDEGIGQGRRPGGERPGGFGGGYRVREQKLVEPFFVNVIGCVDFRRVIVGDTDIE
ncbi:MAG: hypothetical protein ACLPLP_09235 [Mycobacterium sp.]